MSSTFGGDLPMPPVPGQPRAETLAPLPAHSRAQTLIRTLDLAPHPEGGWYREVFRSRDLVLPGAGRPPRPALTTIDFLLARGQFSAWHRVLSDEVWHLLEGGPLRLWLMPPTAEVLLPGAPASMTSVLLSIDTRLRHVVPAGWWQAAETQADFAYVGATVAPGFDFADFSFGRDDANFVSALARQQADLARLL